MVPLRRRRDPHESVTVRRYDCFPFAGNPTELLLLECRLTELYDAVDGFVIVEATVDHQDHPKPLHYREHEDRYAQWADKIHYVAADRLPTLEEDPGPWGREHAQREWIAEGLRALAVDNDDIVLQSDLDEIPTALTARNVRPQGKNYVGFHQRGHFFAVDWQYPPGWRGTVAARAAAIPSFRQMRDCRNFALPLPNAGWHFSWLGGTEESVLAKVRSFCHPEVEGRIIGDPGRFMRDGIHVDGVKLQPVEVDRSWPLWMRTPGNVPAEWFRPDSPSSTAKPVPDTPTSTNMSRPSRASA